MLGRAIQVGARFGATGASVRRFWKRIREFESSIEVAFGKSLLVQKRKRNSRIRFRVALPSDGGKWLLRQCLLQRTPVMY
jgi:hypothetical protein